MPQDDPPFERRSLDYLPGYAIANDGTFWSRRVQKAAFGTLSAEWKLFRPHQHPKGYLQVTVRPDPSKRSTRFYIHRLVLEAFKGPCPLGMQACHNNGDPTDNRIENLRWGTVADNLRDKHAHGKIPRGERARGAKLTDRDIPVITRLAESGVLKVVIARAFQVNNKTIRAIVRGESWRHVPR